ncbi:MAG TPA: 2-dehydropantoate 2-reductase [Terriglobales bacterium]|nr:2-dehydropantoate 2-reductase [Terriglobales bacterium]
MKVLIVGAGAVGAYIGARLTLIGVDVTLVARGPQLEAIRERGVQVQSTTGDFQARPKICATLAEVGPVDVVFLGVKAHSLPQLAPQMKTVLAPNTTVVSTQNGVPWWFFENFAGDWNGLRLERVDPGGVISAAIEARRVIGSIVYFSTEVTAPGIIRHIEGNRISLGEPDGTRSERLRQIADALVASGLRAPITAHIRNEIWVKLLGNVAFNPLSALTGATLGQMVRDPDVSNLAREMMREAQAVAARLGLDLPISIEQRLEGAKKVGEHKTSMLQDLEAHRPLELEAIVGAIVELGQRIGVPMPHTRTIYSATKLLAECRNLTPRPRS